MERIHRFHDRDDKNWDTFLVSFWSSIGMMLVTFSDWPKWRRLPMTDWAKLKVEKKAGFACARNTEACWKRRQPRKVIQVASHGKFFDLY